MPNDYVMTYDFLKTLYADVMSMLRKLCVKRDDMATGCETTESARTFELYLTYLRGDRYFYNTNSYNLSILKKYLDPERAVEASKDPSVIPEDYLAEIVEEQEQYVIYHYEEQNEYYRMLLGLPSLDTRPRDYIYVKDREGIDPNTPIHELGRRLPWGGCSPPSRRSPSWL